MSTSTTPLFVFTLILFCYALTVPGLAASSDKYDDSQPKSDSLDSSSSSSSSRNMGLRPFGTARRSLRSMYGFEPRMVQISRSKIPIELDLLVDNENDAERAKRFDDYGHMRFGKRGGEDQFDDYGHMRFGR